jgi:NAD(P)-dependent dehydrogenase (short-subunit alcohol dehydrogenase family)
MGFWNRDGDRYLGSVPSMDRPAEATPPHRMGASYMNRILITGATGRAGRQVVSQLLAMGVRVRAVARNPDAAGLPPQVEVVRGDLTLPETLDECLDGIDAVFLVWCASAASAPPAMERIAKHARRIVFLSSPYQTAHPLFQGAQPNPISSLHAGIERLIRASGLAWTFLRPGMFAANALWWWAPQIRAGDVVRWPYALAPRAPIVCSQNSDVAWIQQLASPERPTIATALRSVKTVDPCSHSSSRLLPPSASSSAVAVTAPWRSLHSGNRSPCSSASGRGQD